MSAEAEFWAGFRGDLEAVRARAQGGADTAADPAWRTAARALLLLAGDAAAGSPRPADLSLEVSREAALATALGADLLGWNAFLSFDAGTHRAAVARSRLAASAGGDIPGLYAAVAELRQAILDGGAIVQRAAEVERRALDLGHAPVVVEAAALRALAELEQDVPVAVGTARRAARMARTEGLPLPELLANLVLARARRFSDRPHLSVRILRGLARYAPDPWLPWLAWELTLAGAATLTCRLPLTGDDPSTRATRTLLAAYSAACAGDRPAFDDACAGARAALAQAPSLGRELERFRVGVDPTADADEGGPALARWCRGETREVPHGLVGVALQSRPGADDVIGYVVAGEHGARRIFGCGVGLAPPPIATARPGRTETAACVLALNVGRAMDKRAFFREVYGFDYRRELHQGPLDVLVHRLRKAVSALEIEREEERIVARLRAPFSVPDPRCGRPLDERVLEALAERNGGSAREMAKALAVSLRTVQGVVQQLAADGACVVERQGRRVVYRVEDTTFSEPTRRLTRRNRELD